MPKHRSHILQPGTLSLAKLLMHPMSSTIAEEDEKKESDTIRRERTLNKIMNGV